MNADPTRGQLVAYAIQLMREDGYDLTKPQPLRLLEAYMELARDNLTYRLTDVE